MPAPPTRPRAKGKAIRVDASVARPKLVDSVSDALVSNASDHATPVLILVYGRHCGHCIAFEDDWNSLSSQITQRTSMNTIAIEANNLAGEVPGAAGPGAPIKRKASALVDRLSRDVFTVPYIAIWTPDGSTERFVHDRTPDNILSFVNTSLERKAKVVSS